MGCRAALGLHAPGLMQVLPQDTARNAAFLPARPLLSLQSDPSCLSTQFHIQPAPGEKVVKVGKPI